MLKKFLVSLLTVGFLACGAPVLAANSCTAKTDLPISLWRVQAVTPVECVIDTINTDVTIYTPTTGYYAAIVGMDGGDSTAHTFTFTNASDAEFALEVAAGVDQPVPSGINGNSLYYVGQKSAALKVQSTVALTGSVLFYVIQAKRFDFLP